MCKTDGLAYGADICAVAYCTICNKVFWCVANCCVLDIVFGSAPHDRAIRPACTGIMPLLHNLHVCGKLDGGNHIQRLSYELSRSLLIGKWHQRAACDALLLLHLSVASAAGVAIPV